MIPLSWKDNIASPPNDSSMASNDESVCRDNIYDRCRLVDSDNDDDENEDKLLSRDKGEL
jgi:hypothetical protein